MLHNGNDPCASACSNKIHSIDCHAVFMLYQKKVLFDHICNLLLSLVRLSQCGTHQASDLFLMLPHDCMHLG